MKKVSVFIDGQNLYHSLRDIGLKEIDIDWGKLINSLLSENDELVRSYWFRPSKIQEIELRFHGFRKWYITTNHPDKYDEYYVNKKAPGSVKQNIQREFDLAKQWIAKEKQMFSQVDNKYTRIATKYDDLEILRTGILKIDPFKKIRVGEKGVDVALAVTMVKGALQNKYDKAILISGDYDYQEAVQIVKDATKKLHLVRFHKGKPPKDKYTSRQLISMADKVIDIYQTQLEGEFKNND